MSGYAARATRTIRTLSPAERKKILGVMGRSRGDFRDYTIVCVALGAGLRESEICGLNVGDVASSWREVRSRIELRVFAQKGRKNGRSKAKTQRIFPSKTVRRVLLKFLAWKKRNGESVAPEAPLFIASGAGARTDVNPTGRLAPRSIRHMWRTWQTRAGIGAPLFTFHELRHTFGTKVLARTKNLRLVQRAMRHASVQTTEIYTHVSDDELRRALEDEPL